MGDISIVEGEVAKGGITYAEVENFDVPQGYFSAEDMEAFKLACVGPDWTEEDFNSNKLNIRRAWETRVAHADLVKRTQILKALKYNPDLGTIGAVSVDLLSGLIEIRPGDEDPEQGRFIKHADGKLSFGPIIKGAYSNMNNDLDGWPLKDSLDVLSDDQDAVTHVIGMIHTHPNLKIALERMGRGSEFTGESSTYSSAPSLPDLLEHVRNPELVLGLIITADKSVYVILRPGKFLDHFKKLLNLTDEEWSAYMAREAEIGPNSPEEESINLAQEFADRMGLKLYRGKITDDDKLVLDE